MSIEKVEARMKANIWKAIAQNELDLSCLDKEAQNGLIEVVTAAALLELDHDIDESIGDSRPATVALLDDDKEDILWEGRPFMSVTRYYIVTDERIRISEGFLGKTYENIELVRIQDVDYSQTMSERVLKIGDINIHSHDTSHPAIILENVKNPASLYEILRRAVLAARKKHNFSYREEM